MVLLIHVPASTYCGGASFSSSSKWWTLLLFTETGRRLPCHGAEDVSLGLVQQTTEISQLQSIDQVFNVLVVQFQQIRAKSWGDGRDPKVATRILLDKLLLARCVQQQMPVVVAVIDGCVRPCDHA